MSVELFTPWLVRERFRSPNAFWVNKSHRGDKATRSLCFCPVDHLRSWDLDDVDKMRLVHTLDRPEDPNFRTSDLFTLWVHSQWGRDHYHLLFGPEWSIAIRNEYGAEPGFSSPTPLVRRLMCLTPLYWWPEVWE